MSQDHYLGAGKCYYYGVFTVSSLAFSVDLLAGNESHQYILSSPVSYSAFTSVLSSV